VGCTKKTKHALNSSLNFFHFIKLVLYKHERPPNFTMPEYCMNLCCAPVFSGLQVLESIIQQVVVVEYTVHDQMCDECHRREAQDFWRAVVQVRQKVFTYFVYFFFMVQ